MKCDDSTDTETFSEETTESSLSRFEYHTSNLPTINMSSTVEIFSVKSLQPECGKCYAIYYEQRWYLGLITKIVDGEYVVKFLKKKRKSDKEFPKSDDVSKVSEEFIFYGPIEVEKYSEDCNLLIGS